MNNLLTEFGKYWLESRGRNRPTPRYPFPEKEIVSPDMPIYVSPWWNAYYLNLHPTHYAVAIAPDGQFISLKGGYNFPLPAGRYILHYVDKQNRVSVIPRISEVTLDGAQVSLELVLTYRVVDPIKALEVQHPIDAFFISIQSDLKEFIRSHKHDEIVGSNDGRAVDNSLVTQYIREQHLERRQMSRLFLIVDIVVEQKVGDPKLTEIRESFQAEKRQNIAKAELLKQNQELERKVAEQDAEIKRIKAESEAAQQDIIQTMQLQKIELEDARLTLQTRQAKTMRAMDAIVQAVSAPAAPGDRRGVEIAQQLLDELRSASGSGPEATASPEGHATSEPGKPPTPERIDALTETLLNWLNRR